MRVDKHGQKAAKSEAPIHMDQATVLCKGTTFSKKLSMSEVLPLSLVQKSTLDADGYCNTTIPISMSTNLLLLEL